MNNMQKVGCIIVGTAVIFAMGAIGFCLVGEHFLFAVQPVPLQSKQPRAQQIPVQQQKARQIEKRSPSPAEVLRPLGERNLSGFTTWLRGIGTEDPNNVYSIVESVSAGEGVSKKKNVLRISGEGMGYLATLDSYKNYHLSLEYRWGEKTDGSGIVRNSGILLHATGPDGNAKGLWMASIECQLAQGCEGDLIVIRGNDATGHIIPVTIASSTVTAGDGKTRWSPTGKKTAYTGKQFWWSRHQVGFEERLDNRGKDDVASPLGEWTRVDCLCQSDCITIKINGVTVNKCFDVFPSAGKILLENEGNEIFFRNIEIRPLSEILPLSKADR